jgi:CheY-like chemotaxis protein
VFTTPFYLLPKESQLKNVTLTASDDTFREAAIKPDAGLMVEDPDRAEMDSIIIALLVDIVRAKHVENVRHVTYRVGPLGREELYWNVCEDEPDELDAGDIAASIALPVALASGELPPAKRRSTTTAPETSGRIVIAEDDEVTRMLLDRVLTRAGFTVHACENGQLAYDAVRRDGADVVLLDWMMPVMDGPTAVARLKANLDTRGIPVVMLTAQSEIDQRVVALKTGVQDFLTKPFDTRELVARIEQQLRWRKILAVDANASARQRPAQAFYRPIEPDSAAQIANRWDANSFRRSSRCETVVSI